MTDTYEDQLRRSAEWDDLLGSLSVDELSYIESNDTGVIRQLHELSGLVENDQSGCPSTGAVHQLGLLIEDLKKEMSHRGL